MNVDSIINKIQDRTGKIFTQGVCSSGAYDLGEMQRLEVHLETQ